MGAFARVGASMRPLDIERHVALAVELRAQIAIDRGKRRLLLFVAGVEIMQGAVLDPIRHRRGNSVVAEGDQIEDR